eukprot:Gb_33532 [translate_table: standard]
MGIFQACFLHSTRYCNIVAVESLQHVERTGDTADKEIRSSMQKGVLSLNLNHKPYPVWYPGISCTCYMLHPILILWLGSRYWSIQEDLNRRTLIDQTKFICLVPCMPSVQLIKRWIYPIVGMQGTMQNFALYKARPPSTRSSLSISMRFEV